MLQLEWHYTPNCIFLCVGEEEYQIIWFNCLHCPNGLSIFYKGHEIQYRVGFHYRPRNSRVVPEERPFCLNWLKHSVTIKNNKIQLRLKVTWGFKYRSINETWRLQKGRKGRQLRRDLMGREYRLKKGLEASLNVYNLSIVKWKLLLNLH